MHRVPRSLSALALASLPVLAFACGGQPAAGAGAAPQPAAAGTPATTDRTILTREEIMRGEYPSAYDAVFKLRRNWITYRAGDDARDATPIRVYLDDMRIGSVEDLKTIAIERVERIKFWDPIAAYVRYGFGHDRGVVQVISRVPTPRPQ